MKKIALLLLVAVLAGCVSIEKRLSNAAEKVIDLIDDGNSEDLIAMTSTPFLLDGEIIILDQDIADFWVAIIAAGFNVGSPVLVETVQADEETFRQFAETKEVESYFQKYVTEECHLVIVETEEIRLILIMDRPDKKNSRIIGLKGPIEL